jgi:hypothetical protein
MATTASRSQRRTEQLARVFLRLHDASERRFARAVARFFREQGQRLIAALAGVGRVQPHDIDAALDWHGAEHRRFIREVARPNLFAIGAAGATLALQIARVGKSHRPTAAKAFDDDDVEGELPEGVRAAVRSTVEETLRQHYWLRIQDDTREVIHNAIDNAFDNQFIDERRLGKLITTATGGEIAKHRAKRMARTETTGAANGGQSAVIDELAREGLVAGKTWLAINDNDTRESHRLLNGKSVKAGKNFHVGETGAAAPYPGHFSLPAEERINCRCTIIGSGVGEGA